MPKRPPCFDCGKLSDHNHHVVPRVLGGVKTIPLCIQCHAKVHGRDSMATSSLIKAGMAKARANGKIFGQKRLYDHAQIIFLKWFMGFSHGEISKVFKMPRSSCRAIIARYKKFLNKY